MSNFPDSFGLDSDDSSSKSLNNVDNINPNTLRGASRYLETLETRIESDLVTSSKYRAMDIARNFNDLGSDSKESASISLDLYRKVFSNEEFSEKNPFGINSSSILNLDASPEYSQRFLQSSPQLAFNTFSRYSSPTLDYGNPAVVSELTSYMFEGAPGFTLAGLQSRLSTASDNSASPTTIGDLATAVERSLIHRSTTETVNSLAGFHSRPDVGFYSELMSGASLRGGKNSVKAVFFQFQNTDLMSTLFQDNVSFELVTQRLDEQAFEDKNNSRISILAGNELILNATQTFKSQTKLNNKEAYGVQYSESFHPKVGYVTMNLANNSTDYVVGFIGSQNITPATSRHSTIESILLVRSAGVLGQEGYTSQEGQLFKEIKSYTDTILGMAKSGALEINKS
jgi:hypothetical protein